MKSTEIQWGSGALDTTLYRLGTNETVLAIDGEEFRGTTELDVIRAYAAYITAEALDA